MPVALFCGVAVREIFCLVDFVSSFAGVVCLKSCRLLGFLGQRIRNEAERKETGKFVGRSANCTRNADRCC